MSAARNHDVKVLGRSEEEWLMLLLDFEKLATSLADVEGGVDPAVGAS